MSSTARSLARRLVEWRATDDLPRGATADACAEIVAYCDARLMPAGAEGAAVLYRQLRAVYRFPEDPVLDDLWIDVLAGLPAQIAADAVKRIIAERPYSSPPTPGDVTQACRADERMKKLHAGKLKAQSAAMMLRLRARTESVWGRQKAIEAEEAERRAERVRRRVEGLGEALRAAPEPDITPERAEADLEAQRRAFLAQLGDVTEAAAE